jgi:hypothetical protein
MLTRDDFIDIVMERLSVSASRTPMRASASPKIALGGGESLPPAVPVGSRPDDEMRGRRFFSEYDIKRRLTAHPQELRIP